MFNAGYTFPKPPDQSPTGAATMSSTLLTCEPRMYPPQKPSRSTPPLQERRSKRFTISIPEPAYGFETLDWCQLEHYSPYPDLAADFDTIRIELPEPTSCESLNSFCPPGESSEGSPSGTPRSKEAPGEASESTGSLPGFGFAEVVETSEGLGGDAMEPSEPEEDPPADQSEDASALHHAAVYSQLLQGLQADDLLATAGALHDALAGAPPATAGPSLSAPAGTFPETGGTPVFQLPTAGERFQQALGTIREVAAAPRWRNTPYWLTRQELERAPGPFNSQAPFAAHPHALPASLPPLGREFPQSELQNPQTQPPPSSTSLESILTNLWGTPNLGANRTANPGVNQPVTFDLREGLGGPPPPGAGPDVGIGRSLDMLVEEWTRRGIIPGGSLPSLPHIPSEPPAPMQLAPAPRPQDVAALLFPPQLTPYLNVTIPEPTLTSLASRPLEPLDLWRREGSLAGPLGRLSVLLPRPPSPLFERSAEVSDLPGRISDLPPRVLQRVASAPPLAGATLSTLIVPTDPALESPGVASAVQLASSEGSPAATSAPTKGARKRGPKGRAVKGQLEKAPSLKRPQARPPSPMNNPVPGPLTNPEDNPPQNPGGDQGAAADPTSMGPKRTFSVRSTPSLEEPGVEGEGQATWRSLKKPRDASPGRELMSAHSSGGGSAAGSQDLTAPPIESKGPKEGDEEITRNRAQKRQDRRRRLNELRTKPCGCTQDWPNDMQELRAKCNEQSLELRSLRGQQNLMNRRDSQQTQEIEELKKTVADLTRERDVARAQLAHQGAVP